MREGVHPVDKSGIAAQLNRSNLENLRLQRQLQDLQPTGRNTAARDVAAPVLPAELPQAIAHSVGFSAASVQSEISSLSSPKQIKKLFDKELSVDMYFRYGSEEKAPRLLFPTLTAADAVAVMATQAWTQHHHNSQKASRRRYWKN